MPLLKIVNSEGQENYEATGYSKYKGAYTTKTGLTIHEFFTDSKKVSTEILLANGYEAVKFGPEIYENKKPAGYDIVIASKTSSDTLISLLSNKQQIAVLPSSHKDSSLLTVVGQKNDYCFLPFLSSELQSFKVSGHGITQVQTQNLQYLIYGITNFELLDGSVKLDEKFPLSKGLNLSTSGNTSSGDDLAFSWSPKKSEEEKFGMLQPTLEDFGHGTDLIVVQGTPYSKASLKFNVKPPKWQDPLAKVTFNDYWSLDLSKSPANIKPKFAYLKNLEYVLFSDQLIELDYQGSLEQFEFTNAEVKPESFYKASSFDDGNNGSTKDVSPPNPSSFTKASTTKLEIKFDEGLAEGVLDIARFKVSANGKSLKLKSALVSTGKNKVILEFGSPSSLSLKSSKWEISYKDSIGNQKKGVIQDAYGNDCKSFYWNSLMGLSI